MGKNDMAIHGRIDFGRTKIFEDRMDPKKVKILKTRGFVAFTFFDPKTDGATIITF